MKPIIAFAAVLLLAACTPGMPPEMAGKVQKACADLGLVSSIERGNNNTVTAVRCSTADNAVSSTH